MALAPVPTTATFLPASCILLSHAAVCMMEPLNLDRPEMLGMVGMDRGPAATAAAAAAAARQQQQQEVTAILCQRGNTAQFCSLDSAATHIHHMCRGINPCYRARLGNCFVLPQYQQSNNNPLLTHSLVKVVAHNLGWILSMSTSGRLPSHHTAAAQKVGTIGTNLPVPTDASLPKLWADTLCQHQDLHLLPLPCGC
jgi:hypothetical protein